MFQSLLGFSPEHHVRIQRQTNKEKTKLRVISLLINAKNQQVDQNADRRWCRRSDVFLFPGRYEWFQLFAHQLLWVVDVRGLWQIPSWERAAGGVGEQSRVSSRLHGAGTEAKQPPQLTHAHKETRSHASKPHKKKHTLFSYFEIFREHGGPYLFYLRLPPKYLLQGAIKSDQILFPGQCQLVWVCLPKMDSRLESFIKGIVQFSDVGLVWWT